MINPPLPVELMALVNHIKETLRQRCRATYLEPTNVIHLVHGRHVYVLANPAIPMLVGVDEQGELVFGEQPNIWFEYIPWGEPRLRVLRSDLLFRVNLDGSDLQDGATWAN